MADLSGPEKANQEVSAPAATSGFGRDVVLTALASVLVLVGNAVIASLLARRGVYDVFEPYNVAKRVGNVMYSVLTLGMTIGAVRYFAAARTDAERNRISVASIVMLLAMIVVGTMLMLLAPGLGARVLIGEADVVLGWATWAFSVALATNSMVYAFYRAELRQSTANLVNLVAIFVLPLGVVLAVPREWSGSAILSVTSVLIIVWSTWLLGVRLARGLADAEARAGLVGTGRELLAFSALRMPAGVGGSLLLAMAPWYARSQGAIETSALLVTGLLVSQMASAALQAFGIVLLPRVSKSAAQGASRAVGSLAASLAQAGLVLSLTAILPLMAISSAVVPLWLGEGLTSAVPVVRVVAFSLPGVVLFSLLRSVADGAVKEPLTTYATVGALVAAFAVLLASDPTDARLLAAGYVAGESVMAAVLLGGLWRRFEMSVHVGHLAVCLGASAIVAGGLWLGEGAGVNAIVLTGLAAVGYGIVALGGLWFSPGRFGIRAGLVRAAGLGGR